MNLEIASQIGEIRGLETAFLADRRFLTQSLFPIEIWTMKADSQSFRIIAKITDHFDLAVREAEGLLSLSCSGANVPRVYGILKENRNYLILMEYCGERFSGNKDRALRENLLQLYTSGTSLYWGEEKDNYIGSLRQKNSYFESFSEYWIETRILPMVEIIESRGIRTEWKQDLVSLTLECIGAWNLNSYKPRRIHGDLWSGNVLYSGNQSYLIDPSTSFGNPEQDLAMLSLFGSSLTDFSRETILEAIDQKEGWQKRVPFWLIYPLLVHVAIFGESYLSQLKHTIGRLKTLK